GPCAWITPRRSPSWTWSGPASPTCSRHRAPPALRRSSKDRHMTGNIRDTVPGAPGNGENAPPAPGAAAPEPVPAPDAAEAFAADTASAERLPAAEPDYKDRWLRAEAEIQNTRRRLQRDRDDAVRGSEDRILLDMIEVLDDLERALAALPQEPGQGPTAWAQGVALTAQRLRDALVRRAVTAIPTVAQ